MTVTTEKALLDYEPIERECYACDEVRKSGLEGKNYNKLMLCFRLTGYNVPCVM